MPRSSSNRRAEGQVRGGARGFSGCRAAMPDTTGGASAETTMMTGLLGTREAPLTSGNKKGVVAEPTQVRQCWVETLPPGAGVSPFAAAWIDSTGLQTLAKATGSMA